MKAQPNNLITSEISKAIIIKDVKIIACSHRMQCDEYATRGPERLKCVTRGVSYAVC